MTGAESECVATLKRIVTAWPRAGETKDEHWLRAHVTPDFDDVDFENQVAGVREIEDVDVSDEVITIRFWDDDATLQRAVFRPADAGHWKLQSLKFRCPICFGEGVNDGEACLGCSGSGWGGV